MNGPRAGGGVQKFSVSDIILLLPLHQGLKLKVHLEERDREGEREVERDRATEGVRERERINVSINFNVDLKTLFLLLTPMGKFMGSMFVVCHQSQTENMLFFKISVAIFCGLMNPDQCILIMSSGRRLYQTPLNEFRLLSSVQPGKQTNLLCFIWFGICIWPSSQSDLAQVGPSQPLSTIELV